MKLFDVQSTQISIPADRAYGYIADPANLPQWTNAFAVIDFDDATNTGSTLSGQAQMQTPSGAVPIELEVRASRESRTVDWYMTFPDQSVATAFSRVIELTPDQCAYSFVLTPPPVPLEALEGALEQQSDILVEELKNLKGILEND